MPRNSEIRQRPAFEAERHIDVIGAYFVGSFDKGVEQFGEVDRSSFLAL